MQPRIPRVVRADSGTSMTSQTVAAPVFPGGIAATQDLKILAISRTAWINQPAGNTEIELAT